MPFEAYEPDPNRLQWAPGAKRLWYRIRNDLPITKRFAEDVTTAAGTPSSSASPSPSKGATSSPSSSASPSEAQAAAAAKAAENGLCA